MLVKSISLKNFKVIQEVTLVDMDNVTYLVGENGCGKSSILEALHIASVLSSSSRVDAKWWGTATNVAREGNVLQLKYTNPNQYTSIEFQNANDGTHIELDSVKTRTKDSSTGHVRNGNQSILHKSAFLDASAEELEYSDSYKSRVTFNKEFTDNKISRKALINFLNEFYCPNDEEVDLVYKASDSEGALMLRIVEKGNRINVRRDESLRSLARGFHHLIGLYFSLREKVDGVLAAARSIGGVGIVLLEEPESHLHPNLQKLIPHVLDSLLDEFGRDDLQFIITTHSPFIVSEGVRCSQQKVYLLKRGYLIDFEQARQVQSAGYKGERCLNVVAQLLGAGLNDIAEQPKTYEDVTIFYCEGQRKVIADSAIYSRIFNDRNWMFVGCGGAKQVINAYYAARGVVPFVFGKDTECFALLDCSCSQEKALSRAPGEFFEPTSSLKPKFSDEERIEFLSTSEQGGYRMLKRKEIENYLFDPSVVALLSEEDRGHIQFKTESIDYVNGEVKDLISCSPEIKLKLAGLIEESKGDATKNIYEELLNCLKEAST